MANRPVHLNDERPKWDRGRWRESTSKVCAPKVIIPVIVSATLVAGEAAVSHLVHSLALLSDAACNFSTAALMAITWYALCINKMPPSGMTYHRFRFAFLFTQISAISLAVAAVFIHMHAADWPQGPHRLDAWLITSIAGGALTINWAIRSRLRRGPGLTLLSRLIRSPGNLVASLAVLSAGVLMLLTGLGPIDSVTALLIAPLICWKSWHVLEEGITVLCELTPIVADPPAIDSTPQGACSPTTGHSRSLAKPPIVWRSRQDPYFCDLPPDNR